MSSATRRWLAGALATFLCLVGLTTIGSGSDLAIDRLGWVVMSAAFAGLPAAAYLAGGIGLGTLIGRVVGAAEAKWPIEVAAGIAAVLALSHGLGMLGLLNVYSAAGVTSVGLALLARRVWSHMRAGRGARGASVPMIGLLAIPAVVTLLIAASSAPGWLWGSEFGGFDALSYHLQLPRDWIERGRIESLEHSVYSFLPSAVESGFMHIAVLMGAKSPDVIVGDGWWLLAAQWMHALVALIAAWMVGALTRGVCKDAGLDEVRCRIGGMMASGLTITLPWVVVTGSLAYNEMAVVLFGAAALIVARECTIGAGVRGVLVGGLVGAACTAKPTALFMIGPVAGLMMLACAPRGVWARLCVCGAVAGCVMLGPWLARNVVASGNPVFPALTGVFGSGHWTSEQVERFAAAHRFDGGLFDRVRVAIWSDPAVAAGSPAVMRWRGLSNPQWGLLFAMVAASGVMMVLRRRGGFGLWQPCTVLWIGLTMQLVAWLVLTHVQARFLLPTIVTAVPLVALTVGATRRVGMSMVAGGAVVGVHAVWTVVIFGGQRSGLPNEALVSGVRLLSGDPYVPELHDDMPLVAASRIAAGRRVLLIGGATPLYARTPIAWSTTWDTSLWTRLMAEHDGDGAAVAEALRERGIALVLIDLGELERYASSGWLDPRLDRQALVRWAREHGRPAREWRGSGTMLYEIGE